ncbi:MAG: hypothetical protein RLZ98_3437 [Pseudomonadota bacterium]|jgi:lipopolysaccharide transport system ATP-binding protein
MSDVAISIRNLSKSYHRYSSHFWQAAALLGFTVPPAKYDVFWPLDNISIDIRRGERVALIGRNGAGKTTLLRHVSRELTPTEGAIAVEGEVKALFGLGDGFHPEFSGLENLRTALALNGIAWSEIPHYIDEIIEFTELEEFIERPLKEYSAGMYARLGFAVATAIKPEILIIDEILGAGDAYFIGKCQQRIRQITGDGTTLLFVSHDMGSAQMMCERGIWLYNGRVQADGAILPVIKRYQEHIRSEEEVRLRASSVSMGRKALKEIEQAGGGLIRLIAAGNKPPVEPCHVSRIAIGERDLALGEVQVGGQDSEGLVHPIVDQTRTNWSKSTDFAGRKCRAFGDFGGRFTHAPIIVAEGSHSAPDAWIDIDAIASPSDEILVQSYDAGRHDYITLGSIPAASSATWSTFRFPLSPPQPNEARREQADEDGADGEPALNGHHVPLEALAPATKGDGEAGACIVDFAFYDAEGQQRHTLISGEAASCRFVVEASGAIHEPIAVVAVYRPDGTCASQIISARDGLAIGSISGRFEIRADFAPLLIGPGDYVVSIALFRNLDPSVRPEDRAWDLRDRVYKLKILQADVDPFPIGIVNQPTQWLLSRQSLENRRGGG